jgi:hypothetical protein
VSSDKLNNFEDSEEQRKRKQILMEPQLEFTVNPHTKTMTIEYVNLSVVTLSYYPLDLEILFSKLPFLDSKVSLNGNHHFRIIKQKSSALCSHSYRRGLFSIQVRPTSNYN